MPSLEPHLGYIRQQFPALSRTVRGRTAVYFDGPGGTQVPQRVIDAISDYLCQRNANEGGMFVTSRESGRMLDQAHRAAAEFLGADDPACISFGANMTTLTLSLSRALAKTWQPRDEIIVTRLDHDANVTPWVLAARDAGASVRYVDFVHQDCTLDMTDFRSKLSDKTKLVAVGCASNSTGSVSPVREICETARTVGALTFLDAVHYAPHALIDVQALGCDFLVCSPYKFFGPHAGVMWGKRELLEDVTAYKLRPASNELPAKWMTGTQNHECIAGVIAGIDYLADLGREVSGSREINRRAALEQAYAAIGDYETSLMRRLLEGLLQLDDVKVHGIVAPDQFSKRLPTVSITHGRLRPADLAAQLGDLGIFVWHGNYYALQVTEQLGLEPHGMVRIGLVHYNTIEEVNRLLDVLTEL